MASPGRAVTPPLSELSGLPDVESSSRPLPTGWETRTSRTHGRVFYVKPSSGKTTWRHPAYLEEDALQSPSSPSTHRGVTPPLTERAGVDEGVKSSLPLPVGWEMKSSASTGKVYYVNTALRKTTWNHPAVVEAASTTPKDEKQAPKRPRSSSPRLAAVTPPLSQRSAITNADASSVPLPEGWVTKTSLSTGKTFYANPSTGKTTWKHPGKMSQAVGSSGLGGTRAPEVVTPPVSSRTAVADTDSSAGSKPLLEGWEMRKSKTNGRVYYANSATGKTSWKHPGTLPAPLPVRELRPLTPDPWGERQEAPPKEADVASDNSWDDDEEKVVRRIARRGREFKQAEAAKASAEAAKVAAAEALAAATAPVPHLPPPAPLPPAFGADASDSKVGQEEVPLPPPPHVADMQHAVGLRALASGTKGSSPTIPPRSQDELQPVSEFEDQSGVPRLAIPEVPDLAGAWGRAPIAESLDNLMDEVSALAPPGSRSPGANKGFRARQINEADITFGTPDEPSAHPKIGPATPPRTPGAGPAGSVASSDWSPMPSSRQGGFGLDMIPTGSAAFSVRLPPGIAASPADAASLRRAAAGGDGSAVVPGLHLEAKGKGFDEGVPADAATQAILLVSQPGSFISLDRAHWECAACWVPPELPVNSVPLTLEPFGYKMLGPALWESVPDEQRPDFSIRLVEHKEMAGHTWYLISCAITLSQERGGSVIKWLAPRRLSQVRTGLYDPILTALGNNIYNDHFSGTPFALRGGILGTTQRLAGWLSALIAIMNSGQLTPYLVAVVLHFFQAANAWSAGEMTNTYSANPDGGWDDISSPTTPAMTPTALTPMGSFRRPLALLVSERGGGGASLSPSKGSSEWPSTASFKASGPAFDEARYLCWSKRLSREGLGCTKVSRNGAPTKLRLYADPMKFAIELRQGMGSSERLRLAEVTDLFRGLASPDFAKFSQKYNQVLISTELAKRAMVLKSASRTFSFLFESEAERDNIAQFISQLSRLKECAEGDNPAEIALGEVIDAPPKEGYARVIYANYALYEGEFSDHLRQGQGCLTLLDGTKHEGEWAKDERHGPGTEYWVDGTVINSTYVTGSRSGNVEMLWPDGSNYKGEFDGGRANGEGELTRRDGTVYRGQFRDDCISGEGIMEWRGGVRYFGQFVQNRRDGQGHIEWPTGYWSRYSGEWKDSKHHGRGTLVDRNGNCFSGSFIRGRLDRWDPDVDAPPLEATAPWRELN